MDIMAGISGVFALATIIATSVTSPTPPMAGATTLGRASATPTPADGRDGTSSSMTSPS
jgi:hypothetical protein